MRQMIKTLLNKSLSIHRLSSHLRFMQIYKFSTTEPNEAPKHIGNQLTATETTVKNHIYMQYHGAQGFIWRTYRNHHSGSSTKSCNYYYITTNYRSIIHRMHRTLREAINSNQMINCPDANGVTDGPTTREMQV